MREYLIDLKVSLAFFGFTAISFSNVEIAMKIVSFLIMAGYTLRRWHLLEKNKKE
jgi:hypothetical protein